LISRGCFVERMLKGWGFVTEVCDLYGKEYKED
jgi:hypothetical protein